MTAYIVLLVSNLIFMGMSTQIKNGKKVYFWISVLQLALLSGFRASTVGTDTGSYIKIFNNIATINSFSGLLAVREEIGYVLLNKLVYVLFGSVQMLFLICAFITAYGLIKFIYDNTEDLYFGVFLLICLMFFFTSMNAVRQYMATAIAINGWTYLKKKKYIQYFLLVFLAVLFHKMAVIYLALFVVYYMSKSSILQNIFYIMLLAVVVFAEPLFVLAARILNYSGYLNVEASGGIMMLVVYGAFVAFPFISLLFNKDVLKENADTTMLVATTFVLQILARLTMTYVARVAWLFSPFALVLVPNVVAMLDKQDKKYMYAVIGLAGIGYFLYCLSVNWQRIVPYISFFALA